MEKIMEKKVLIYEDNDVHFNLLKNKLKGLGYEVIPESFSDLGANIDLGQERSYMKEQIINNWDKGLKLIICDLHDERNRRDTGVEIIKYIRTNVLIPECPAFPMIIPIIIWTGAYRNDELLKPLTCGANDFVYKPHFSEETQNDQKENDERWQDLIKKLEEQELMFNTRFNWIVSNPLDIYKRVLRNVVDNN